MVQICNPTRREVKTGRLSSFKATWATKWGSCIKTRQIELLGAKDLGSNGVSYGHVKEETKLPLSM